jgi:hypothetical protein
MRAPPLIAASLSLFVLWAFPARAQAVLHCTGAQKSWIVAELFFAREHVSEKRWARFLAVEITTRFPEGLTVVDARGQWRAPGSRKISSERSKVVTIAMPPSAENDSRLQKIIEAYKTRFKQQSVGLIVRPGCVSF